MKNFLKGLFQTILYLAFIFVITLLIVRYLGQRTEVIGSSMVPTLESGDQLITDKISYRFRDPERFDIIVFPFEGDDYEGKAYFIKRIIGMPGETVRIDEDGVIYINGEPLDEHYGIETITFAGTAQEEIKLADDEYFVLGDNRPISRDSRYPEVGPINRKDLIGRAWLRIYPFSQFGILQHQ